MPISFKPRKHQQIAFDFETRTPKAGVFLDMGLGKTGATLLCIDFFLETLSIRRPLIIAPKLVAINTWPQEIAKWEQFEHLTYSVIIGDEPSRIKAIKTKADIYIVSVDFVDWLVHYMGAKWWFDMVVIDESSKFKSRDTKRFKALRKTLPYIKRLIELTGTPIPNGLMDIWAQMFLLDNGDRLSRFIEKFRMNYFHSIKKLGHGGTLYALNPGSEEIIYDKIRDICLSMKAVDWIDMPEREDIIVEIELDDYAEYKKFKREKVLELPEGEITAFNASTLYTKLLQYANGAIYDSEHAYHIIHDKKLDMLQEMVENLQGKPVMILYQFKSDLQRIRERFPDLTVVKDDASIKLWNAQLAPISVAHPKSIAYGLNLQSGGNYVIWYGIPPNQELYSQTVLRFARPGQKRTVFNYHLLVTGTPEFKVYRSLLDKTFNQNKLMEALK